MRKMLVNNYIKEIIPLIQKVTEDDELVIRGKLMQELQRTGSNVSDIFYKMGFTPYVINENQELIYKSDAFIYELAIYNISEIKSQIQNHLLNFLEDKRDRKILLYGDGIGMDSLFLLTHGFNVTYYDYQGSTYEFAKNLWNKFNVNPSVIFAPNDISDKFDIIIAFDVLEHVPDPDSTIRDFGSILNDEGFVVLTAPFDAFSYYLPTHLYSNYEKFHGRLSYYFRKFQMYITDYTMDNLLVYVFQKGKKHSSSRINKLLLYEFLKNIKKKVRKVRVSQDVPKESRILTLFNS